MSGYLLAIAIGPVQEFISAARRTRDLWFGSYVLSEISKAAARAVAETTTHRGLVFPAPDDAADLEPDSDLVVANVVLAELPADCDPRQVASSAKKAANRRWREFADRAADVADGAIRQDVWGEQVDDVVEFYAAWHPLPAPDRYREARRQVMRILAGRKACRDFRQANTTKLQRQRRLPKSSLDGARETVLWPASHWPSHVRRKLKANEGEQLDVVGLTKRLAIQRPYPSVARIAAESWIRRIVEKSRTDPDVKDGLDRLGAACRAIGPDVIHRIDESMFPQFSDFPFEGTTVFRQRHRELCVEGGLTAAELKPLADAVRRLVDPPRDEGRGGLGFGEPSPYLAVLVADGDRMGAAIAEINSADEHRRFSRDLSRFAQEARDCVQQHRGVCVYAGGDDVLAFLPLDSCLDCARELHESFTRLMGGWTAGNVSTTLSVGIAVGHFMEPLEDLLSLGREAETAAKKHVHEGQSERNALAVTYRPRGGPAVSVRDNWSASPALNARISTWSKLFAGKQLPNKLPYELRSLLPAYQGWTSADALRIALQADVRRLLKQKETRLNEEEKRRFVDEQIKSVESAPRLERLAREMYVAQSIAVPEVSS